MSLYYSLIYYNFMPQFFMPARFFLLFSFSEEQYPDFSFPRQPRQHHSPPSSCPEITAFLDQFSTASLGPTPPPSSFLLPSFSFSSSKHFCPDLPPQQLGTGDSVSASLSMMPTHYCALFPLNEPSEKS